MNLEKITASSIGWIFENKMRVYYISSTLFDVPSQLCLSLSPHYSHPNYNAHLK